MAQNNAYRRIGDVVVHRGVYNGKVWLARPAIVVEDNASWTKLLIRPGSVCQVPAGLIQRKYDGESESSGFQLSRWDEQASNDWEKVEWVWRTNRFKIINQPGKYYSISLIWHDETDEFICWYVNFELPLTRSPIGFDTLDLEIDLIVKPDLTIQWKDDAEYAVGVNRGIITADQVKQIERAKTDVLKMISNRAYPFGDEMLIAWRPPSSWEVPQLVKKWDLVEF